MDKKSKSTKFLVAAFDFGTTYSGYAYSTRTEWPKVLSNKWVGGEQLSYKAPTALLLNPDKSFNSFGFDAEKTYGDLAAEGDDEGRSCQEYYFFHRFKMILKTKLEKRVNRHTKIKDENGKEIDAMLVFTECIRHMKEHLLTAVRNAHLGDIITAEEIDFVITVPAIWDDTAKMFMREAAEKADISREQLHIALEPEAASIYCQLMHFEPNSSNSSNSTFMSGDEYGAKYMVVDLGGGTADITVHQMKNDGTLAELVPASGGDWGGTAVDKAFQQFLVDLFGKSVMDTFKNDKEYAEDYFDFWQSFEVKKRSFEIKSGEGGKTEDFRFHVRLPLGLTEIMKMDKNNEQREALKISERIRNSKHGNDEISFDQGKLHIPSSVFRKIFDPTINKIRDHLLKVSETVGEDLKVVLMVGGFSECSLVYKTINDAFDGKCRVVNPNQAGLAVLKGAVYFGHQPDLISERISRYTYGIQTWPKFDHTKHRKDKKVSVSIEDRCKDVFFKFISKGDRLHPGDRKSYVFQALKPDEDQLECGVFISTKKDPKYVDEDGCAKLGVLQVPMSSIKFETATEVEESLIFGHTELYCTACNCTTKEEYKVTFDLLSEKIGLSSDK